MPLITISSSAGSGGKIIGQRVAEFLNIDLYDDDRLQQAAIAMGIPEHDLKSLDEKAPGFFDRILTRKPELYLDLMEAVIYDVARKGSGVILGHGSQILLRDFGCALHVFIHATETSRVKRIMEQKGLSKEAAEKLIRKSDHQQKGFFRFAFQMQWNDPSLYDLIINTEKISTDSAVKLIVDTASSEAIETCSLSAADTMERLSQKKKIEAALVENDINLFLLHVEVPEKGVAEITGAVYSEEEKQRIAEIVKKAANVSEVRSEVVVSPVSY
ncbi:MAG: cytidylate kinase-like family protein [Deltaproteobacteria bacterium]|nr:cytidylate kinase-like family protein [Deltaproteobacteria bacterium]MBW1960287.1 cytidylate kinase-like family protein [Deltaproteobacteria bacterium]MBW1995148.1 cytidylate kinase-like family protein [Deltaproteobacteria bacterium]MBW2150299.1 cytidylate kinase-like family protein [Deltaproteobacteria bacterium]